MPNVYDGSEPGAREYMERRFADLESAGEVVFSGPAARSKYRHRVRTLKKCITLESTIEIPPVLPNVEFFPARCRGLTNRETMYDSEAAAAAWMRYLDDYDPDYFFGPEITSSGPMLDALDLKSYRWPGRSGATLDSMHQYVESEWMKADEYGDLIDDPADFWRRKYLPRICGSLSGLAFTPSFFELFELPPFLPNLAHWGRPEVVEAVYKLLEAGRAARDRMSRLTRFDLEAKAKGYLAGRGGMTKAPFDVLGDTLRGAVGISRDMFVRPEAIKEAAARLAPLMVKMGVEGASRFGHPVVFMPLHKGDDDFMSDAQFRELYWPTLLEVVRGLVENGCVPLLFIEGRYNRRLEYLQDLPPRSTICLLDRTDIERARVKLDKIACVAGGVPTNLLMFKKPEEVEIHCRKTIDKFAAGGGFILSNGAVLDHCPPENMKAMIQSNRRPKRL